MIKTEINLKETNAILDMASENDMEMWQIEGVLNDDWLIEDHENLISINGRSSDYIILTHEYLNSWANKLYVIQTNNVEDYQDFMNRYESELDD